MNHHQAVEHIRNAGSMLDGIDSCRSRMQPRMRDAYDTARGHVIAARNALDTNALGLLPLVPLLIYLPLGLAGAFTIYKVGRAVAETGDRAVRAVGESVVDVVKVALWVGGGITLALLTRKARAA